MEDKYEGEEVKIKSPFLEKLDNFWYHYKWHSLIALFLIVTVTVCSVQMCTREEYDIYAVYAGRTDVKMTSQDALSDYRILYTSFGLVCEDFDENGEVTPNLQTLFLPSEEEIEEIEKELDKIYEQTGERYEVQTQLVTQNQSTFADMMLLSDYYLCFLSEANYLANRDRMKGFFAPLLPYVGDAEVSYYDGRKEAVYLSSTAFGSLPGFEKLDEGTLICLRSVSEVAKRADQGNSEKQFARAERVLEKIFAMKSVE